MSHGMSMDLPNRINLLLKSGEWSDCSFSVGIEPDVKVFKAHKMLLSVASPVFRAMFIGDLGEKSPVKIIDIKPEIFQLVLNFIYTDHVKLKTIPIIGDVWYAAQKYMITSLIDICERRFLEDLDASNACQVYEMVHCFDRLHILQRCLQIITEETYQVLTHSASFEKVQLSTIVKILDSDKINVDNSEIHLFNSLMHWGIAECKRNEVPEDMINVRRVIAPALSKIRFLTLSEKQFTDCVEKWKIFSEDEHAAILIHISEKTAFPLMPEGFSASRAKRLFPPKKV